MSDEPALSLTAQIRARHKGLEDYAYRRKHNPTAPALIKDPEARRIWKCEYERGWRMRRRKEEGTRS